jgi:hypothetical protein
LSPEPDTVRCEPKVRGPHPPPIKETTIETEILKAEG